LTNNDINNYFLKYKIQSDVSRTRRMSQATFTREYDATRRNATQHDRVGKRNVSLTAGVRYVLHTHLSRRAGTHHLRPRDPHAMRAGPLDDERALRGEGTGGGGGGGGGGTA